MYHLAPPRLLGSGKSTLFRILMSCNTNDRPIDIPPSISLSMPSEATFEGGAEISYDHNGNQELNDQLSVTMPSSHVVEISQTFYWPLYSKPIDWISQEILHLLTCLSRCEGKFAMKFHRLRDENSGPLQSRSCVFKLAQFLCAF